MNICKNCGIEIESHRKYCSLRCRNIYVNENLRNYSKNGDSISKKFVDEYNSHPKKCKACDKIIPYALREWVFCSKECKKTGLIKWNENRKGEKRSFSKEGIDNIIIARRLRLDTSFEDYMSNPKLCKECGEKLPFDHKARIFCNIKCKRIYDSKNISEYQIYYKNCQFKFNLSNYPEEFNFDMINEYGWYKAKNHGDNLNGISRDHMISVKYGYENNISSDIISHPANCKLMPHSSNSKKHSNCSLSLENLLLKINEWNLKYY